MKHFAGSWSVSPENYWSTLRRIDEPIMISKEMFDFLKQVQREPRKTEFSEIDWKPLDKNVLKGIIREALELGYIYAVNPN